MFEIDFSELILIYIAVPLFLLFLLWFVSEKKAAKSLNIQDDLADYLLECPYCNNVFIDTKRIGVAKCSVCGNYTKI
jgi:hypothetical protein